MLDKPIHVRLDERPSKCASGRECREEREHVDINVINRIENVLSTTALLITVGELRNGDGYLYACELRLGRSDLGSEFGVGKDIVVQRLGAKLYATGDELGFWIGSERVDERITTCLPLVATIETKLQSV